MDSTSSMSTERGERLPGWKWLSLKPGISTRPLRSICVGAVYFFTSVVAAYGDDVAILHGDGRVNGEVLVDRQHLAAKQQQVGGFFRWLRLGAPL